MSREKIKRKYAERNPKKRQKVDNYTVKGKLG
jgi:hypothetical protein